MSKQKYWIAIGITVTLFLVWYFFFDMDNLPKGELAASSVSPGGEYAVNLYLCGGNATTADSVRGEVVFQEKARNIYWQYEEYKCDVRWESDTVVNINGISLDVRTDTYDWRR